MFRIASSLEEVDRYDDEENYHPKSITAHGRDDLDEHAHQSIALLLSSRSSTNVDVIRSGIHREIFQRHGTSIRISSIATDSQDIRTQSGIMHVSGFVKGAAAAALLLVGTSSATRISKPSPYDKYALLAQQMGSGDVSSSSLVQPTWMRLQQHLTLPDTSNPELAYESLGLIVPGLNLSVLKGEGGNYSLAGIPLNNTASLNEEEIARARNCPEIEFITTRGANDSYPDSFWLMEMARQVMSQLPNGTSRRTETRYNSSIGNDLTSQVNAALNGSYWIANYTTLLAQSCPDTTIIMMAYSLGSAANIIATNRPRFPHSRIKALVYWGSPLHSPGRPQNRGTAQSALGQVGLVGYRTPRGIQPIVRDYCNEGDIICTSSGNLTVHLGYANSSIQDETVDYLVKAALQA
ncbi:acetylxylan esterase [Pseudozyma hubeiensis SY62]|uniref:Acetylxylan esterase n=1 Tax=Pseudozyma hubeiensis (strain SY62) TaxID=1305764 RepID=R9NYK5_PSEHS|nr:acetylxylan esterase [Pseudozyma hubeiensis SY62]GAC93727.1 acetylxylan esterase [Pseudozyma hubeiensis SY62]